jgi:S1-C subfamily serine protease
MPDKPLKLFLYPLLLGLVLGLGFFVGLGLNTRGADAEPHDTASPTSVDSRPLAKPAVTTAAAPSDSAEPNPDSSSPAAASVAAPVRPTEQPEGQLTSLRLDPTLNTRTDLRNEELATIEMFQRVSASVVFVTSIAQRRDFFSMRVGEYEAGSGSGFVWDTDGHIVTNYHVIARATAAIRVTMTDQSVLDAEIVGVAPEKDLAVLRVNYATTQLSPLPLGRSDDLLVGQSVLAIGNPFGLDQTLTTGIISALGRTIPSADNDTEADIHDVIQTDAAINPGNSGGPLLDSSGRLIGVNTAIASPSGAYAGVGFAIPVDTVRWVVPDLIQYGRVQRPGLGFKHWGIDVNRRYNFAGVMVRTVDPEGPAAQAALRPTYRDNRGRVVYGDIITAIDGQPIRTPGDLLLILEERAIGDMVTVTYMRDRRAFEARIRLVAE